MKKKAMLIVEDLFPLVDLVNTTFAADFSLRSKQGEGCSPIPKIRKVWILEQY